MSKIRFVSLATVCASLFASVAWASEREYQFGNGLSEDSTRVAYVLQTSQKGQGRFQASFENEVTWGGFDIVRTEERSGHRIHFGTLSLYGDRSGCSGEMSIDTWSEGRTAVGERIQKAIFSITFSAGNCPSRGSFDFMLREALPRPDANGNYTGSESRTSLTETNGDYSWLRWTVVDGDPAGLNCRAAEGEYRNVVNPDGRVVARFPKGTVLEAYFRGGGDSIFLAGGDPSRTYLRVSAGREVCFVRANTRFILARSSFE